MPTISFSLDREVLNYMEKWKNTDKSLDLWHITFNNGLPAMTVTKCRKDSGDDPALKQEQGKVLKNKGL